MTAILESRSSASAANHDSVTDGLRTLLTRITQTSTPRKEIAAPRIKKRVRFHHAVSTRETLSDMTRQEKMDAYYSISETDAMASEALAGDLRSPDYAIEMARAAVMDAQGHEGKRPKQAHWLGNATSIAAAYKKATFRSKLEAYQRAAQDEAWIQSTIKE